jgi:hypothetical protein
MTRSDHFHRRDASVLYALAAVVVSVISARAVDAFVTQGIHSRPTTFVSTSAVTSLWATTPKSSLKEEGDIFESPIDALLADEVSTLTLLEHVNLNVPSQEHAVPFYFGVLGMGVDPRRAANLVSGEGTIWANCGASQFHLPYGETAQVLPGHVGLRYDSLEPLKARLESNQFETHIGSYTIVDPNQIQVSDVYGNIFMCRASLENAASGTGLVDTVRQPIVGTISEEFPTVASAYGREETECRGIDYVEFPCPMDTAKKIAECYDCVLDAPTTVLGEDDDPKVALVGFGTIPVDTGRASQYLIFRETLEELDPYDGHHVGLYVGQSVADFEHAFTNAIQAHMVWVNPRFKDQTATLQGAKTWRQFRFLHLTDVKYGKSLLKLEHEIRSVQHEAWAGPKP